MQILFGVFTSLSSIYYTSNIKSKKISKSTNSLYHFLLQLFTTREIHTGISPTFVANFRPIHRQPQRKFARFERGRKKIRITVSHQQSISKYFIDLSLNHAHLKLCNCTCTCTCILSFSLSYVNKHAIRIVKYSKRIVIFMFPSLSSTAMREKKVSIYPLNKSMSE